MNVALHRPCEQLLAAYESGRDLILLFDYDGTLVPIVEHPRLAVVPDQTCRILEHLVRLPRVNLGILSGRHLTELSRLVNIQGLYFSGTSGLELDFAGIRVAHPAAGKIVSALERLGELLTTVLRDFCGAWLERKPIGLTVHFRHVSKQAVATLRDRVTRVVAALAGRFRVVESAMSLEITPNLGWDKGTAVRMIVDSIGVADALVLYAGDSANDAEAMLSVTSSGGLTIGVGPEAPASAHVRVAEPEDLREFIAALAHSVASNRRPAAETAICDLNPHHEVATECIG